MGAATAPNRTRGRELRASEKGPRSGAPSMTFFAQTCSCNRLRPERRHGGQPRATMLRSCSPDSEGGRRRRTFDPSPDHHIIDSSHHEQAGSLLHNPTVSVVGQASCLPSQSDPERESPPRSQAPSKPRATHSISVTSFAMVFALLLAQFCMRLSTNIFCAFDKLLH